MCAFSAAMAGRHERSGSRTILLLLGTRPAVCDQKLHIACGSRIIDICARSHIECMQDTRVTIWRLGSPFVFVCAGLCDAASCCCRGCRSHLQVWACMCVCASPYARATGTLNGRVLCVYVLCLIQRYNFRDNSRIGQRLLIYPGVPCTKSARTILAARC